MEEGNIVIYQTEDGQTQIDVRLENESVWLNVTQMAALFDKEESNVRRHILNVFHEGELERDDNNVHFLHVNNVKMQRLTSELGDLFVESHRLEASIREKLAGIGFNVK